MVSVYFASEENVSKAVALLYMQLFGHYQKGYTKGLIKF